MDPADVVEEEIAFARSVLRKVVVENRVRFERGLELRKKMLDDLKRGREFVEGTYRYEWVCSSAVKVVKHLRGLAREFDVCHAEDMASTADMRDILRTALKMLEGK